LETHVVLAERLEMLEPAAAKGILDTAAEGGRLLNGLMNSVERRAQCGAKIRTLSIGP
jgi:hypothetical protein